MKIHAIQTGTVQIKTSQQIGRGTGFVRQLHVLFDSAWSEPLPIYAWAIETREGVFVVDTGETARASEPGYFPKWHPYYRLAVKLHVTPEQEIGPQLSAIGIRPMDVRKVVLTHLHTDHAGGLAHFPNSEILVSREEYAAAQGLAGRLRGYLPNRWPGWFAPHFLDLASRPFGGVFERSCPITADGRIVAVPTPGHSPGHISVIAIDQGVSYFLAGDATYTEQQLLDQAVDGVSPDEATARRTMHAIAAYARENQTIYLPSHDPQSRHRLEAQIKVRGKAHTLA